ncbi:hypothetical protein KSF_048560 [Reticulibacter mediterranei]|uniref:Uncharacterized protein n=1 Tax=Reticulibacter mediterranei TaxID=2778369 RepID=A0A8J3N3V9_9CHLR|nr:hypothetical protein KSF_048560 [Reticulibacter mediterranei]
MATCIHCWEDHAPGENNCAYNWCCDKEKSYGHDPVCPNA